MSVAGSIKRRVGMVRRAAVGRRNVGDHSPRAWLTEVGLVDYKPGPWSTADWDQAYETGALDYFGQIWERARFSVCADYLDFVLADRPEGPQAVLDAGCGDGVLYQRCSHLDFAQWTGVDLSAVACETASRRAADNDDDRARFLAGDLLELGPWSDRPYDVVIISEVLNMCDEPAVLLDRMDEALADDGWVIVSSWRHRGDRALQDLLRSRFPAVHHVDIRPAQHALAPRGWRVSVHRRGSETS